MKRINLFVLLVFFINISVIMAQSAWTKKKGEGYAQITYSVLPTYKEINNDIKYVTSRKLVDNTIQLYGEYGVTDHFTILVNIPIKSISTGESNADATFPILLEETSKTGLGNIQFGFKHKIYDKKVAISGQLTVESNTGSFDVSSGIRTGYDAWTLTPTINLGRGYEQYYFQVFTGVDIRTNSYSSNFRIGGEFGLKSIKNVLLIAFLDVVNSFEDGDISFPLTTLGTALYINDQEYSAVGLKGIYNFTETFGITAGFGGAFSANNVPKQSSYSLGAFYKI